MKARRCSTKSTVAGVLILCAISGLGFNLYLLHIQASENLTTKRGPVAKPVAVGRSGKTAWSLSSNNSLDVRIRAAIEKYDLTNSVANKEEGAARLVDEVVVNRAPKNGDRSRPDEWFWNVPSKWVASRYTHVANPRLLGQVLDKMSSAKIIEASAGKGGTQLKLFLVLEGGQKVVFKPMWYQRNYVINGTPYAGADRHNGEIAAFHLGRLLNFRRGPLVIGRKIDLQGEIIPVADRNLSKTFLRKGNETCFYGICYYCKPSSAVCEVDGVMEGAVILWLPPDVKLKALYHPWSRTYKNGVLARWETQDDYCKSVRATARYRSETMILDLIDTAVFDFLIGNADRHRFEVFDGVPDSAILLLDNGKSFGNPYVDEITILAPLYQCCKIRKSTWERIQLLRGKGILSKLMRQVLSHDPLVPVLTETHLEAMARRLVKVFAVLHICFNDRGINEVIQDDGY